MRQRRPQGEVFMLGAVVAWVLLILVAAGVRSCWMGIVGAFR